MRKINENNYVDHSLLVYGKVLPQAVDIETAVIGSILIDKEVIHQVVNILTDDCFYEERNRIMYLAIKSLYNKSNPIDLLTICDELRNLGTLEEAGGFYYVSQSTSRVASTSNVEYHARVLQDKATLRRLAFAGIEIANAAYEDTTSAEDLSVEAEKKVAKAIDIIQKGTIQMPHELVTDCLKEIDAACKQPDSITGVYSGFENLDRVTYGWQKSDLIILAARPSMGKTSLAMCFARNAAVDHKIPVAVFSLEMSKRQLMKKLISVESEVPLTNILRGMLDETQMRDTTLAGGVLGAAPIYIDDKSLNVFELRAKARRMKYDFGVEMIIVDYIQLMSPESTNKNRNRENEVSEISRTLKLIAKELDIPVIALSQLNRSVESRASKIPNLGDLRESGAIEQDADVVCFLYRPEYYGINTDENGNSTQGVAEFIIAKHRNGSLDTVKLNFIDRFTKFTNRDERYEQPKPKNLTPLKNFYEPKDKEEPEPF